MLEYRVIEGYTGALEKELNKLASEGWTVLTHIAHGGGYQAQVILHRKKTVH